MRRLFVQGLILGAGLLVVAQSDIGAARGISSFPFTENFDSSQWLSDLRWVSQGAEARHMTGVNWDGGNAARIWLPTVDQGYSGLGEFTFAGVQPRRLNIRFVYQWGSSFIADDLGLGPKQLIVRRSTNIDTDRFIAQQHAFGPGQWDLGIGNNVAPVYPNPRVWDYGQHTGQFVCFEFELVVGGQYKVFVTKQNDPNWNQRLLVSVPVNNSNGYWSAINILGNYGGPGRNGSADPNAWFQFSNLALSDSYIGPPAGFTSGSGGGGGGGSTVSPAAPINLRFVP